MIEDDGVFEADAETPDLGPEIPDEDAAPASLRSAFWVLVVVFNVAVGAIFVGLFLVVFRTDPPLGASVFALGVVLFLLGVRRVRRVKTRLDSTGGLDDAAS